MRRLCPPGNQHSPIELANGRTLRPLRPVACSVARRAPTTTWRGLISSDLLVERLAGFPTVHWSRALVQYRQSWAARQQDAWPSHDSWRECASDTQRCTQRSSAIVKHISAPTMPRAGHVSCVFGFTVDVRSFSVVHGATRPLHAAFVTVPAPNSAVRTAFKS
jgi:hypothetical protein